MPFSAASRANWSPAIPVPTTRHRLTTGSAMIFDPTIYHPGNRLDISGRPFVPPMLNTLKVFRHRSIINPLWELCIPWKVCPPGG